MYICISKTICKQVSAGASKKFSEINGAVSPVIKN